MLRGKICSGKITGPVQNYPALSMVFGELEVFKSTESDADPKKLHRLPVSTAMEILHWVAGHALSIRRIIRAPETPK